MIVLSSGASSFINAIAVDDFNRVINGANDRAVAGATAIAIEHLEGDHLSSRCNADNANPIGECCNRAGHMGAVAIAIGESVFSAHPAFGPGLIDQ